MIETPMGLRERKRLETRGRLEAAAVRLVLQQGLESTTVDQISRAADVSPRTFFNYFESKEDALLGLQDAQLSDETIVEHLEAVDGTRGAELVRFVIRVLVGVTATRLLRDGSHEEMRQLGERYPQLLTRMFAHMNGMSTRIADAVRLVNGDESLPTPRWPELLVAMCGTAVRVSIPDWATAGSGSLTDLEERAFALFTETLEKLT